MAPCSHCGHKLRPQARFCPACGASLVAAPGNLPAAAVLRGRYRVLRLVARGGMGAVYQVEDRQQPSTLWALKEMTVAAISAADRAQAVAAFQREANLLLSLQHPNLPRVLDLFEEHGRHFLVMAFVDGDSLEQRLERVGGPLPVADVLHWAGQLCDVLGYLHAQRPPLIHRDLKPANVMVDRRNRVQLIDFGIARFQRPGRSRDTVMQGTEGYASPEHYGRGQTEARSDLYCLGAALYHALTGRPPATVTERLLPPPGGVRLVPPRQITPAIPAGVEAALLRAMELDPAARFGRAAVPESAMAEMQAALAKHLEARPQTRACPRCGRENLLGSLACFACGYDFSGPAAPAAGAAEAASLHRTDTGLVIATPENVAGLLALPQPPGRVWWEQAEMELCLAPGGAFLMGSAVADAAAFGDERPQHEVILDPFYIGRYPVTWAQYARFKGVVPAGMEEHPAVQVSWYAAAAFCRWAGLRLPVEAEWEKAARGADGRIYPWGDRWDVGCCNSDEGGAGGTTPVGAYSPGGDGPYSCADLAGNVWEWTADWYEAGYYRRSPSRSPAGPASGAQKVSRGGSWRNWSWSARCACRNRGDPAAVQTEVGFRCAVSART